MQSLIGLAIAAYIGLLVYEVVYYIPYIISHITEILAYISVVLIVSGTGLFVILFGGKE